MEVLGRFAASSSENLKWVREERLFSDVVELGKRRYLVLKTIGSRKGAFGQFQKRKVKDRAVVDLLPLETFTIRVIRGGSSVVCLFWVFLFDTGCFTGHLDRMMGCWK